VLQIILYIPVFSYSDVWFDVSGFMSCCSVVVVLNAVPILVLLNRLVIFLIFGLW